ncbi:sulfatase-like hydrolase/transferase [Planctomycetota bacterium]
MPGERPNIVLFITEHWRGDCLGRLGHPAVETPHIDGLSAKGALFKDAYTPCPSCIAARRSIMTGLSPDSHGMVGYQDGQPWRYEETLAGELARAGYQTINVGKTHFHPDRLHLGFEELIIPADYDEWIEKETGLVRGRFAHGVHGNSWMSRPNHLPEIQMEETWLTNEAMKRINKRDPERPFFICISYNGAHPPLCPPKDFFDMFLNKEIPDPVIGKWAEKIGEEAESPPDVNAWQAKLPPDIVRRTRVAYYAYLAYLDTQVGRFIEFLNRSGLRNTFYLLTADHGEMLGDHYLWRKTYAFDGSARIPFVAAPPPGWDTKNNREIDSLVGLEDVMPTLLDVAGVPIPEHVEGKSILPLLRGDDVEWRENYHHEHSPCYRNDNAYQCLTSREWKYVWNPINGDEQLFSRIDDPYELNNLSEEPSCASELEHWRIEMAQKLKGRPENLSDGKKLVPGSVPVWRAPKAKK